MCINVLEKEWRKFIKEEIIIQNVLCKYFRVKGKGDKKKNIIYIFFFWVYSYFLLGMKWEVIFLLNILKL